MSRALLKRLFALLLVTVGLLSFDTSSADAQYYGWWRRGPVRRTAAFVFSPWVRSWRIYYGGYGGYWGCGACSVDWHAVCDACKAAAPPATSSPPKQDVASLVISVPPDAQVFVNGGETTSTGPTRTYFSRGLLDGEQYKYEVRIVAERDKQQVEETKTVFLTGGTRSWLDFDLPAERPSETLPVSISTPSPTRAEVETVVRLHLPSDAKVTLGGNASRIGGTLRTYRTRALAPGETWRDYRIVAEANRDGRRLVADKTITLAGGEIRDVYLDFAEDEATGGRTR